MPLRLDCRTIPLTPGSVLQRHFGAAGLRRPLLDAHVVAPDGSSFAVPAQIDSGSDYTIIESAVARHFGFSLPFPAQAQSSGAAGALASVYSFPPAGLLSLFVTDYREFCYLTAPLMGFHPPGPSRQRSVLGLAGFLEHFRFMLDHGQSPPTFELHPLTPFPGVAGALPRDRPLADFIRSLRGST
jgi:hypothetical protein